MIKTFCDRCGKDTTDEHHSAISGVEDADNDGNGTNQAPDCFDIVCDECFELWRAWMKGTSPERTAPAGRMSWAVEVRCNGVVVVTIEDRCLSGRDLSAADEDVIRDCAAHLLAFVGGRRKDLEAL